jgi:hypothetical protein
MFKKLLLLLSLSLLFLAACQAAAPATPAAAPLPLTGARASRLGASVLAIQSNPDQVSARITPIAAGSGKPISGYAPFDLGSAYQFGFSPSREQLAVVSYGAENCPKRCFHLLDLRTWKESLAPVEVGKFADAWTPEIVFDPSGQFSAFALNDQSHPTSQVVIVDIRQGRVQAQVSLDHPINRLRFLTGGQLVVYGPGGPLNQDQVLRIAILDPATLDINWQMDVPGVRVGGIESGDVNDPTRGRYLDPGVAFSADGSKLYIVAADEPRLVTVDLANHSVRSAEIQPRRSLLDRLVEALSMATTVHAKMLNGTSKTALVSPDGQRLFVAGQTTTAVKEKNGDYSMDVQPFGLQVIDLASATEVAHLDTDATFLELAPDGKALFLYHWPQNGADPQPWTQVLDLDTLKVTQTLTGEVHATRLLNGEMAWLSAQFQSSSASRLAIYTPGQPEPRVRWSMQDYAGWVLVP